MLFSICKSTHFIWISEIYFQPPFESKLKGAAALQNSKTVLPFTFFRYPECATVAPSKNRILNPDIELAVRFKLRENKKDALSRTFALLWIASQTTFYLWARTLQITQFIFLPRFDHFTHIGGIIVRFGIDSVKITIILGIYLLMHLEDIALDALYRFLFIIHILFNI